MIKKILRFVKSTPNLAPRHKHEKSIDETPIPKIIISPPNEEPFELTETSWPSENVYKREDPQIFLNLIASHLYS